MSLFTQIILVKYKIFTYVALYCVFDTLIAYTTCMHSPPKNWLMINMYLGYVSWGEYPMNFAAVLNQEEIYRLEDKDLQQINLGLFRLILAKGGNFDLQDTNGCTVTHIMVVFDNINVGTFMKKRTEYFYLDV